MYTPTVDWTSLARGKIPMPERCDVVLFDKRGDGPIFCIRDHRCNLVRWLDKDETGLLVALGSGATFVARMSKRKDAKATLESLDDLVERIRKRVLKNSRG